MLTPTLAQPHYPGPAMNPDKTHVLVAVHAPRQTLLFTAAQAAAWAGDAQREALVAHGLREARIIYHQKIENIIEQSIDLQPITWVGAGAARCAMFLLFNIIFSPGRTPEQAGRVACAGPAEHQPRNWCVPAMQKPTNINNKSINWPVPPPSACPRRSSPQV